MLIPKIDRQFLRSIGHPHWFWDRIPDWAFGERYKFRDGKIAYLYRGKIITIRKGGRILWRAYGGMSDG
jgi:hypothetical protein